MLLKIFITEFIILWIIGNALGVALGCTVHELIISLQNMIGIPAYHGYFTEYIISQKTTSPFIMPLVLSLIIAAVSLIFPIKEINSMTYYKNNSAKIIHLFKCTLPKSIQSKRCTSNLTIQPKEALSTATKAKLTITNFLGGEYFLTVDEIQIVENTLYLIESKHTKNALFPSKSDIKDGLLKLILYCNFATMRVDMQTYKALPVLKLTSTKLKSAITSNHNTELIHIFLNRMNLKKTNKFL